MSTRIYHLSLGSNLGDRLMQLQSAREKIQVAVGASVAESSVYETQPWGVNEQPLFLNRVMAVASAHEPHEVLSSIKQIEKEVGRLETEKWNARHIDIDILLCEDLIINESGLVIPHPYFHERNFVLVPLMEIASQVIHPVLQLTIEELYMNSRDTGEVYIFNADEQGNPL
jgi:2-amino-4-hydroxy-6-hydroxymethyldihydropteridine diphosphokinase